MAQMIKNLPAVQETQAQSLGREILWRRKNGKPLQYSCLMVHEQSNLGYYSPWDCKVGCD